MGSTPTGATMTSDDEIRLLEEIFGVPGIAKAWQDFKEDRAAFLKMLREGHWDLEEDSDIYRLFKAGYEYGLQNR